MSESGDDTPAFECTVSAGVCRVARPGTRWLATGWAGGYRDADAAYNVEVPEGFAREDLDAYARERRAEAGFAAEGPTLLTGVSMDHARGARAGPVTCVATAGLSNPAALPMGTTATGGAPTADADGSADGDPWRPGTVNLLLGTTRSLADGALASLLACAVEAKAATLLAETGFPGTTTDAVVVGTDPVGDPARFAGSATEVGGAARACVREAVRASLRARYDGDATLSASVPDAEYGVSTDRRATTFRPAGRR